MPKPTVDPDASSYDVFAIYGALMQQVQAFEVSLATLALLVELDPNRISNASLERQVKAAVKKGRHAFQAGSPAASRGRLKGKVSDELYAEIDRLIPHRNRLAHRFLVERMYETSAGPHFKPGTALQITEYAQHFFAINRRLKLATDSRVAALSDSPAQLDGPLEKLARAIVLNGEMNSSDLPLSAKQK